MKEKQEDGGGKEKGVKTGSGRGNTVLEAWSRKVKGLQLEGNHCGPSRKQGPIQKGVTRTHVWTRWGSRRGRSWETETDACNATDTCVNSSASEKLLHSSGNSA